MNSVIWKTLDYRGDGLKLLEALRDEPFAFFLDSSLYDKERGRYSFIGCDPFEVFKTKGRNSLKDLKARFGLYQGDFPGPSPLAAGIVGFLGYDFGLYLENITLQSVDDLNLPDCLFGFYDCIITIDHQAGKLHISSTGLPETNPLLREKRAQARLDRLIEKISFVSLEPVSAKSFYHEEAVSGFKNNLSKTQYLQAADKALDYIRRGDIYQVNLSQRFSLDHGLQEAEALELYDCLRRFSPSSFGGYFDCGDFRILSSSPERFLSLKGKAVTTRPMKGTRPRGQNPVEDRKQKEELLLSRKDEAELLMITDLERNDLGRVCEFGTVKVKDMRTIEEYTTVFQATSTIEGTLAEGKDAFDLLSACFPGGSITGCPKIRAMNIIEEIEPTRRGPYTGCLGYISFLGDMDFNILIRTILSTPEKLYFQTGGGIVADSKPEEEYNETLVKARAIMACINQNMSLRGAKRRSNPFKGLLRPAGSQ